MRRGCKHLRVSRPSRTPPCHPAQLPVSYVCGVLVRRYKRKRSVQLPATTWPAVDQPIESTAPPRSRAALGCCWRLLLQPQLAHWVHFMPCCHANCRRHASQLCCGGRVRACLDALFLPIQPPWRADPADSAQIRAICSLCERRGAPIRGGDMGGEWGENKGGEQR